MNNIDSECREGSSWLYAVGLVAGFAALLILMVGTPALQAHSNSVSVKNVTAKVNSIHGTLYACKDGAAAGGAARAQLRNGRTQAVGIPRFNMCKGEYLNSEPLYIQACDFTPRSSCSRWVVA